MPIRKDTKVILESAARTATPSDITLTFDNPQNGITAKTMQQITNLHVIIDVSALAATPSVTPEILATDPVSGRVYPLLTGSAITAVTTGSTAPVVLRVGRDIEPAANAAARDFIPELITLRFTHADADSITYSVGVVAEFDMVQ